MMDTPRGTSAEAMDGEDRISGLPDELRHHIVSFLPARDAVRTFVLSPKWRHTWASARRLNVYTKGFTSQRRFIKFVNALLLSRGCTPLESFCLFISGPGIFLENFHETAYLWIRHALRSKVKELYVGCQCSVHELFQLQNYPITSSYLKKLSLCLVYINNDAIKKLFSGCPALEDLELLDCDIVGTEFSSATLKRLSIDTNDFPNSGVINMPSLVSLHLVDLNGALPSLVNVQSLRTASINRVGFGATFADVCNVLGALSNAKDLELMFPRGVEGEYSLRSDMQLCQVEFANLTSLSLSDWCLHDNCKVLLYLLEHSPNLEELNLQMTELYFRRNHNWNTSAAAADSATPFNCKKLRKVEIVCPEGDKTVGMLVTILLTKVMSSPEIRIKPY